MYIYKYVVLRGCFVCGNSTGTTQSGMLEKNFAGYPGIVHGATT